MTVFDRGDIVTVRFDPVEGHERRIMANNGVRSTFPKNVDLTPLLKKTNDHTASPASPKAIWSKVSPS
jgi:hypothetical protein